MATNAMALTNGGLKMGLFRAVTITSLLLTAIPCHTSAAVGAKSLQGLFSSDECEVVPELLGPWTSPGVTYSVRQGHHNSYWMIDRDADSKTGNKLVLEVCAAHINGQLFYDATFQVLRPGDEPTLPPEFVVGSNIFAVDVVAGFWVPMHIIGRLEIEKNALHFRNIDDKWLQVSLQSRLISVASAQDDSGEYFLTANGKQLKAFVASIAADPKAFSDQQRLTRTPEPAPN